MHGNDMHAYIGDKMSRQEMLENVELRVARQNKKSLYG
jgi:hypothetical protein